MGRTLVKTWLEPVEVFVPPALAEAVGGHPLIAQTLVRRGIMAPAAAQAFLDPRGYSQAAPFDLPGMGAAVDRLQTALRRGEHLCVWGDFDVDGQTATTVLVSALRALGGQVSFHIPVRGRESHGINLPVLERVIGGPSPAGVQLVLTCDTGVGAHEAVAYASARGVDFVITDHHELPETLPPAVAVVNPRRLPAGHPLEALPGVGVAYKLAEALLVAAGQGERAGDYLDLVALGIVADVARQLGDTRCLLQLGLQRLRDPQRAGLRALCEFANLEPANLSEEHIGFVLGPRLNALGRLADANLAVELLTTSDLGRARVLAQQVEGLNAERQLKTSQIFKAAVAQIESDRALQEAPVLVLEGPAWEAGVIGIVASRLVERYDRPAVLVAAPPGQVGRGSARSVVGVNITAAIAACRELLLSYGGHPMAAGLSIDLARLPDFRRCLQAEVARQRGSHPPGPSLQIDAYLDLPALTLALAEDLERLAPFGEGNPLVVLAARRLELRSAAAIGREGEHLALTVEDQEGNTQRVLWWQGAGEPLPEGPFDLAFALRAATFKGQRSVQLEWLDCRPVVEAVQEVSAASIQVLDHRAAAYPVPLLKQLLAEAFPASPAEAGSRLPAAPAVQVWAEAGAVAELARLGIAAARRGELVPAPTLVIWTPPPARPLLQTALAQVRPQRLYLFNANPALDEAQAFLTRLAGLVKPLLRRGEPAHLEMLAATMAHTTAAVRTGLLWLQAHGDLRLEWCTAGEARLSPGDSPAPDQQHLAAELTLLLEEAAAFRAYYARAPGLVLARLD